ncbi:hypothetical protein [Methylobacterium nonmethylotrophicum]|uniref:hypothetical protein n=1 Tax=Methylobacterium nonmethylotrophicum TaxID=1141884 RepID=UPI001FE1AB17|nr:hypothetical protein [Methylobacterium nonmethylotrophicum]
MVPRLLLPLAALAGLVGPALAQSPLTVRVRPPAAAEQDIYARAAARGPVVLQVDPDVVAGPLPPGIGPGTGLVAIRAVPVAAVTNGGGFGPTGFGYYGDSVSEGPLDGRRRVTTYILGSRAY